MLHVTVEKHANNVQMDILLLNHLKKVTHIVYLIEKVVLYTIHQLEFVHNVDMVIDLKLLVDFVINVKIRLQDSSNALREVI